MPLPANAGAVSSFGLMFILVRHVSGGIRGGRRRFPCEFGKALELLEGGETGRRIHSRVLDALYGNGWIEVNSFTPEEAIDLDLVPRSEALAAKRVDAVFVPDPCGPVPFFRITEAGRELLKS